MDKEKIYIATFCFGHVLHKNYVEVSATSLAVARMKMFNEYGNMWGFMYPSEEAANVKHFNLVKVPFGTTNQRL